MIAKTRNHKTFRQTHQPTLILSASISRVDHRNPLFGAHNQKKEKNIWAKEKRRMSKTIRSKWNVAGSCSSSEIELVNGVVNLWIIWINSIIIKSHRRVKFHKTSFTLSSSLQQIYQCRERWSKKNTKDRCRPSTSTKCWVKDLRGEINALIKLSEANWMQIERVRDLIFVRSTTRVQCKMFPCVGGCQRLFND